MYLEETLARNRYSDSLEHAQESRRARQLTDLRRAERQQQRAERKMMDAWRRADELRDTLHAAR
ncbi:MAG TPA: hypothetical protein VK817_03040 [Trebonia sp.]|jgi:hypothetical protein|nr:hypothetical protein [Trebonia sp.]